MLALLKKQAQKEFDFTIMEGKQLSSSLQSPLEVPEESIRWITHPRTETLDTEMILKFLRELRSGQNSILAEVTELRTTLSQMNQCFEATEFQLSSLESRTYETQQKISQIQRGVSQNSILRASQSDPRAMSAASTPSFTSHQMILDAAQTAASPSSASVCTGDSSSECASPSPSEHFRTSSTLVYTEIQKSNQMLPDEEVTFERETAKIDPEEPDNFENISSNASLLITPENETEPQALTSIEETVFPKIVAVQSLQRISENVTAHIEAEESVNQEDTFSRALSSIALESETAPQALTSTEETVLPKIVAVQSLERISENVTAHIEAEESVNQEEAFSRALSSVASENEIAPQALTSTEETVLTMNILFIIYLFLCIYSTPSRDVQTLERISENMTADIEAEESVNQEDTFFRALSSVAPAPKPLTSTEETVLPMTAAVGSQEIITESRTALTEQVESRQQENSFSGASPQAYKPAQQFLMGSLPETSQLTGPSAMQEDALGRATQLSKRHSTRISSSTAFTSTTPSAGTLGQLSSSSPTNVRPPTKRRKTSFVWDYFIEQESKYIATCNICKMDVKTVKIRGSSSVGIVPLHRHLNLKHGISKDETAPSELPAATTEIQDSERPSTVERPNRTTSAASTCTTASLVMLSRLPLSPPADMRPSTRCRKTSFVWEYFTEKECKYIVTCNLCKKDVKTGQKGANVGTAAQLSHLKRIHGISKNRPGQPVAREPHAAL